MQRFDFSAGAAVVRNFGALLTGRPATPDRSAIGPQPSLATQGLQKAGMDGLPDGLVISADVARLLGRDPGASRHTAPDAAFDPPAYPLPPVPQVPSRGRRIRAPTPAATPVPDIVRYQSMTVRDLLGLVAECAATYDDAGCAAPGADGTPRYHARFLAMAAALQARPERQCDLAHLQNAYFALRAALIHLRHLAIEIRSSHPELEWVLRAWALHTAAGTIDIALALPLGPDGREIYDPRRYAPVMRLLDPPLAFHVAGLRRRSLAAASELTRQVIDSVFEQIYAAGSRVVDGAAIDIMAGSALESFNEGLVRIRCGAGALPRFLHSVPSARLVKVPASLLGLRAAGSRAAYPGDSGIGRIVWVTPAGSEFEVLVHEIDRGRQSYSIDRGGHWLQTGAPCNAALQALRIRRWGQFVDHRRQDATEPAWRLVSRGPYRPRAS
jgi:hypothetical protein